ncbi:MAG: methyltransferase domain-containing protein [Rhodospirillaceae bacterium]|nr:methyltransferase domain-containing protein [Rhodospirillaceae bacterium]
MWLDVVDLRDFYARALGRLVQGLIARQLRTTWPNLTGQRVLGLGFAVPYLGGYRAEAERVIAVMPPAQGVMHWPEEGLGLVSLAEEFTLPLPDRSIDRLLLVHCLESTAEPRLMMRECWRVLADGGRIVVVVANRASLWARFEVSPFAHGRPYSLTQLTTLLRDGLFAPRQTARALFLPPAVWRLFAGAAGALDRLGNRWFPTFAGVHIVEAEKQIYAIPFQGLPAERRASVVARPAAGGLGHGIQGRSENNATDCASAQTPPAR